MRSRYVLTEGFSMPLFGLRHLLPPVGLAALLLSGCAREPIVARSPEALLALAKEQMANANYTPASDTLGKVLDQSPQGEFAAQAHVLRLLLLGGMARGYKEMGSSFLEGYRKARTLPYASGMRAIAMDYFGRSRGRSIEMVEALDRLLREPPGTPLRLDLPFPPITVAEHLTMEKLRAGRQIRDEQQAAAEEEKVREGLAGLMAEVLGAGESIEKARASYTGAATLELEVFYLAMAQEMVEATTIYKREALDDPRMLRLYHERASALALRAAELADSKDNQRVRREAGKLHQHCQKVLAVR